MIKVILASIISFNAVFLPTAKADYFYSESYGEPDFFDFSDLEDTPFPNPWMLSKPKKEKIGPSQSIGKYGGGCLSEATAIDDQNQNFSLMRLHRYRNYGHDVSAEFIEDLGNHIAETHNKRVLVGDIGQPMGGPIYYPGKTGYSVAHGSHQTGLDIDIWYLQAPRKEIIPYDKRGSETAINMADPRRRSVTADLQPSYLEALIFAAKDPRVSKILIDPAIKNHLCQTFKSKSERSLLKKFRPVRAHNYHYHVRLKCDPNDSQCVNEAPPSSEACDLDDFFKVAPPRPPGPPVPPKPPTPILRLPKLPLTCKKLL